MKDNVPFGCISAPILVMFPENSQLGTKKHSLQRYTFGSYRPKIKGKMHKDQNIFSPVRRLLLELFA